MEVYHGGARENEKDILDFSYSTNPYVPGFLKSVLKNAEFTRYPYCADELEEKLKERYKIKDRVVIGAGITELLNMFTYHFKNKKAVVLEKSYGEYKRVAELFGLKIRIVKKLDPTYEDLKLYNNEMLYFSNPNNPTGKHYSFLKDLAEDAAKHNSYLIVDEAFIDFVEKKSFGYAENIVTLRSFTKSYNIPGIRVGYAIVPENISEAKKFRMPWSIGALGCSMVKEILKDQHYLQSTLPKIFKERERISRNSGLKTNSTYFLADVKNAEKVTKILKNQNILVRDCSSFKLPSCIRFSIKKRSENNKLIKELEKFNPTTPRGLKFEE